MYDGEGDLPLSPGESAGASPRSRGSSGPRLQLDEQRSGRWRSEGGPSSDPTGTRSPLRVGFWLKARALVAQLDRAPDFESGGRGFESLRARHFGRKAGSAITAGRDTDPEP